VQIDQITFTRFIAALSVVFFHYGTTVFPASVPWLFESTTAGPTAVNYFYVLSGFIMAIAYYQVNADKPLNVKRYWIARFARIYPVYLVALLLMAVASSGEFSEKPLAFPLHLTMLQAWVPGQPMTFNNPGWSLSVEAFFYLSFPLLLWIVYRSGLKYLLILGLLSWLITQFILLKGINSPEYASKSLLHDFLYYNPLMHINAFIVGLIVGVLFKQQSKDGAIGNVSGWVVIAAFLLIVLLLELRPAIEQVVGIKLAFTNGLIAPAFLLFIWLLASSRGKLASILSHPFLVLLGEASFSLYILQKPIFGLYNRILEPRLGLSEAADFYVALVLLIIISILSFKLFETPARELIKRKLS